MAISKSVTARFKIIKFPSCFRRRLSRKIANDTKMFPNTPKNIPTVIRVPIMIFPANGMVSGASEYDGLGPVVVEKMVNDMFNSGVEKTVRVEP